MIKNRIKENEKIFNKSRKYWTEQFNSLPDEVRHVGCASSDYKTIQYLELEKQRLKDRYRKSLAEINDHIENQKAWLRSNFKPKENDG